MNRYPKYVRSLENDRQKLREFFIDNHGRIEEIISERRLRKEWLSYTSKRMLDSKMNWILEEEASLRGYNTNLYYVAIASICFIYISNIWLILIVGIALLLYLLPFASVVYSTLPFLESYYKDLVIDYSVETISFIVLHQAREFDNTPLHNDEKIEKLLDYMIGPEK